jgi:hydroxymethylpyrimidine pyrophosphatase-like HAD family hydrolase
MFNGSVAPMRVLAGELRAMPAASEFSVALTEYEHRDFSLLDVNGAGCSKGSTLARWTGACGFTRDEVMAVGDNLNDLDMLEFAGTAVVMGNAAESLKGRGFHLTGTNDEEGLATAVRSLAMGFPS